MLNLNYNPRQWLSSLAQSGCQGVFFALFLFVLTTYLISEKAGDLYSSRRPARTARRASSIGALEGNSSTTGAVAPCRRRRESACSHVAGNHAALQGERHGLISSAPHGTAEDVKDIPSLMTWLENDFVPLATWPKDAPHVSDSIVAGPPC